MIKKYLEKIKVWYNNREPQDYYDPFAGLAFVAKKKNSPEENK